MCATCGCSDDSQARLTDLRTGKTVALETAHGPLHDHDKDDHHHHHHHHDHASHDHAHGHHHHDADHAHATHSHGHDHGHHHHDHDHDDEPMGKVVTLEQRVLARNDALAERVRGWLAARNTLALNLVSSPGAGKTTLLERTIRDLGATVPISVIEGDQQTLHDAERIQATGAAVVQINTGTACHLDAAMIARALPQLDPPAGSLVMIENVGNLVCPSLFDLGERAKVVVVSVTEGEDKPAKYPHMFRASELMILNKIDLLPHVTFDVERCLAFARQVNPRIQVIQLSATRGDNLDEWYAWLQNVRAAHAEAPALV